jgi:hypothetical protein
MFPLARASGGHKTDPFPGLCPSRGRPRRQGCDMVLSPIPPPSTNTPSPHMGRARLICPIVIVQAQHHLDEPCGRFPASVLPPVRCGCRADQQVAVRSRIAVGSCPSPAPSNLLLA